MESTVYRDYQDFLTASKEAEFEPESIRDARLSILENQAYSLRDVSRLNSVYRGVMCLVALRGAKDFCADDSIQFHTLEDHHIFPDAYLKKQKIADGKNYAPDRINCVINRTLIADETNRKISKRSPSDYANNLIPPERCEEILQTHYIGIDALEAMHNDNFESFTAAREKALIEEIRKRIE